MQSKIKACDIMVDTVIFLKPEMTLTEAWQVLMEHRISGAPVVNRNKELLGVLSQTDLAREAFVSGFNDFPRNSFYWGAPFLSNEEWGLLPDKMNTLLVDEVMTSDPICADVEDDIARVATLMRSNHIHRIIVMDGKRVAGIISSIDMLKLIEQH